MPQKSCWEEYCFNPWFVPLQIDLGQSLIARIGTERRDGWVLLVDEGIKRKADVFLLEDVQISEIFLKWLEYAFS